MIALDFDDIGVEYGLLIPQLWMHIEDLFAQDFMLQLNLFICAGLGGRLDLNIADLLVTVWCDQDVLHWHLFLLILDL